MLPKPNILLLLCTCIGVWTATAGSTPPDPGSASSLRITSMSCDHAVDPIAVDHPTPTLGWRSASTRRGARQSAYRILVSRDVRSLQRGIGDLWDSGKRVSDNSTNVVYAGVPLAAGERCYWKVRVWDDVGRASAWSTPGYWQIGLLEPSDWHAQWISACPEETSAAPVFRREFTLTARVTRATAYVYGLGWYELFLNGQKVGDHVLAPANSHYDRLNLYDSYDVTSLLRMRGNAVGIMLGGGYDSSYSRWGWKWEGSKRCIVEIHVELEDGSRQKILSDDQWRCHAGPITACGIYAGETYDARNELDGWDTYGCDDRAWRPVQVTASPGGRLVASTLPPLRVTQTITPVSITEPRPGVYVADMGQNFAGWARIHMRGERGDTVRLHYSELIDSTGMIDPWTNRIARATEVYVFKGRGMETYEPRFTYHGFRFVEITGPRRKPTPAMVEGRVVHADLGSEGSFACSDTMLNRVARNFRWGMTSNFMSFPTDCPMRNERTPCSMDSRVYEEAAMYLFPMYRYYRTWLRNSRGVFGNPDWDGDQVLLPWRLFACYGDTAILRENYTTMRTYVDTIALRTPDLIYRGGYGDWCAPNEGTWPTFFRSVAAVNTALFFQCAETVAKTAAVLGDTSAAHRYARLADAIRSAYNAAFYHPDANAYGDGSQTEDIMPLALGIVTPDNATNVAAHLARTIVLDKDGHLDTGITGTTSIGDVLCDHGYGDLAVRVYTNETYPGFGHQIRLGATTTWEQWSPTGEMHSHNHAMFSGAYATLFSRFGGVRAAAPGYERFIVQPATFTTLTRASVVIETIRGRIRSSWRREGEAYALEVEVPVGSRAEVHVPIAGRGNVSESGKPAAQAPGVTFLRRDATGAVYNVGGGVYRFVARP